ncbi:hypothetical protein ACFLT4_06155 [Chloroflexota bacterium]
MRDVATIEKLGKPATFIVSKHFGPSASFNAKAESVPDISLTLLPLDTVPKPNEIEESKLGEQVAEGVITALCQRWSPSVEVGEATEKTLVFSGSDYSEAVENMEKYFLQHCWSDGFPLVPPTQEAVNRMLEGTELSRDYLVAIVEPGGGKLTMEKIAINAVMAGCLPQYMPTILAAVEAITDPLFDLRGVQCTAGMVSPLLIVSGPELIKQLNINDSFSTIGPGWRANTTIGWAIRLIMINTGYGWPGRNDMKTFGSPFKYVPLMAENESAYSDAWEPIRVAEGFDHSQPTVSVMPAVSWQVDSIRAHALTAGKIIERISKQGQVKYDKVVSYWGKDNLVLLSPSIFDAIRKEGLSRIDVQKALYDMILGPCLEFYDDNEPAAKVGAVEVPEWVAQKCCEDPKALVPLLREPQNIKIVVAGAPGPAMIGYVCTWGAGPAFFITKPVKSPRNRDNLLEKYGGWETPIVK